MRIVIIGAGLVGSSLAEQLLFEGHDIAIVESDGDVCRNISEKLDLLVVEGSGSNPRDLDTAGIAKADILLAVTPRDEINIIACNIAMQYGVPERIARIRDRDYVKAVGEFDLKKTGVNRLIEPEMAVAEAICQFIATPGAIEATSFENHKIFLREYKIKPDAPIAGERLMDVNHMTREQKILIMTIVRDDKAIIPSGEVKVEAGDEILAVFPAESKQAFLDLLNIPVRKTRKVIISGDNLTCYILAKQLKGMNVPTVWVSMDARFGRWAADRLDTVEILHGDSVDMELLREIHAEHADFFIGAGKNTEHNIMAALLAKSMGCRENIVTSDQPAKSNKLFQSIGIDHVINPRLTTAASIMDLVHRGRILSEIRIRGMDLETIRIIAGQNARVVGLPLAQAWRPLANKAIVGAIIRNEQLIIPTGSCIIHPGDQAMVVTRTKTLKQVKSLFQEHA